MENKFTEEIKKKDSCIESLQEKLKKLESNKKTVKLKNVNLQQVLNKV